MRIVIAGGTGLIARALAAEMVSASWEVVVLSRNPSAAGLPDVRLARWDGRTIGAWASEVDGAQAVVNLAGVSIAGDKMASILFSRWTGSKKQAIRSSRAEAGSALTQAIRQAGHRPAVFVQASGVNYYGIEHQEPVVETMPPGQDFLASVCVDWEAASQGIEPLGVRRAIIRSGVVLSARGGILPMIALPFRLMIGGRLGSGRQWIPWIDLRDEVAAIRHLIERPDASGPFNLVAPEPTRSDTFGRAVGHALHRPFWFPAPAFLLRLMLGEKAMLVLDGCQIVPRRLLDLGFTFRFPTADQALTHLYR